MTTDHDGGSAVQPPLFTEEGSQYYQQAYKHNRPFATRGPYQTRLNGPEEAAFQQWVTHNSVEFNPNDAQADYDLRGWWRENRPGPGSRPFYNDKYKTPYDTTFSNQSIYATPNNPFMWKDDATLIDIRDGSIVFFNPSHYASNSGGGMEQPNPIAAGFPDLPGFNSGGVIGKNVDPGGGQWPGENTAPAASRGSGYGTRWHAEVVHVSGQTSPLQLRKVSGSDNETHWTSDYQLQPGDRVRVISNGGKIDYI